MITASYLKQLTGKWAIIIRTPPTPVVVSAGNITTDSVSVKWTA
jgi:hypothetical protein